jgi:D-alanyl-D-alanine endopeptidase (penicillin-binding protein 7)
MRFLLSLVLSLGIFSCNAKNITATSWLVADEAGKILIGDNTTVVHPIASISKLMTVMVVIDASQDLNERLGKFTRREHMMMALVKSVNSSADELCNNYPNGRTFCVRAMNAKARSLFMTETKFADPTGLSVFNVSTANDLINLVIASKHYSIILEAGHTSSAKIKVRKKWLIFKNTNPLIGYKQNILISKTGYIKASGGCLVMMVDTEVGKRIVVLLGSKNTHTRIPEAEIILRQSS